MANKRGYKQLHKDSSFLHWWFLRDSGVKKYKFKHYCDERGLQSKHRSLQRIGNDCGVFTLIENGGNKSFALHKLLDYLNKKKEKADQQLQGIHYSNQVLTTDETALVVNTCKELATMGLGIDEDTCLMVVNSILWERIDMIHFTPVTRWVISLLIKVNLDLLKLTRGNSIDPKCVWQADTDVRDALFVKLENFIKF